MKRTMANAKHGVREELVDLDKHYYDRQRCVEMFYADGIARVLALCRKFAFLLGYLGNGTSRVEL